MLKGSVHDAGTGEALVGAVVKVKGMPGGVSTDLDGRFSLPVDHPPPFTLSVVYFGYKAQDIAVGSLAQDLRVGLVPEDVQLKDAEVVRERISDRQKQAPMTVETMDLLAIKEVAGGDFYEGLGNLKGVDMTAASFGFKVINTRGFNSTSPVRSLQLIDGVDNQSPGLNFSLGNFLGASDLDVLKVDVIAGASTAYYGPGAFNGVINMTTKSPWTFPGLSASLKGGERNMLEMAVRWAEVLGDSASTHRWAYKLNAYALRADDWPAENYAPTSNSPTGTNNPGGYDAVNIYGDEDVSVNNDYTSFSGRRSYPGLGKFLRNGYREVDLVDYGTHNIKLGGSLHYRIKDSLEVMAASNFSTGSTVYQGDNRYRLKDIQFFQHRLELRREGKWFIRAYVTHEDAGKTYDIYTTALRLQEASGPTGGANGWNFEYNTFWGSQITPQVQAMPGYITVPQAAALGWNTAQWIAWQNQFIQDHLATFFAFHDQARAHVNTMTTAFLEPFFVPGTARFNEKIDEIKGKRFTDGGSLFFDRSALAHVMGEYKLRPKFAEVTVGGNFRQYMPNSAGTIFRDTGNVVIRNSEFGLFAGMDKKLLDNKLTATATLRLDKNQNFKPLLSPALSLVYARTPAHVWRASFSSAIRNPTLADQYLYYNVGRALLLGNVDGQFEAGRDSMFTIASFQRYRDNGLDRSLLDWFHVDRLRPEQVRTIELGYRGTHWESLYFDLSVQQLVHRFHRLHHRPARRLPGPRQHSARGPAGLPRGGQRLLPSGDARLQRRPQLVPAQAHLHLQLQLQQADQRCRRPHHPRLQHPGKQVQRRIQCPRPQGALHPPQALRLRPELEIRGRIHLRGISPVLRPHFQLRHGGRTGQHGLPQGAPVREAGRQQPLRADAPVGPYRAVRRPPQPHAEQQCVLGVRRTTDRPPGLCAARLRIEQPRKKLTFGNSKNQSPCPKSYASPFPSA